MEELEKALRVIKEECKSHVSCRSCPLRNESAGCYLRNHDPENYSFESDATPESKRIFA